MNTTQKAFLILMMTALFCCCSTQPTGYNGGQKLPYDDSGLSQASRDSLWNDAACIALRNLIAANPSYNDSVTIPEDRIRFYYQDLVNLYNDTVLAARDSVFNLYPIRAVNPEVRRLSVYNNMQPTLDSFNQLIISRYNMVEIDKARFSSRIPCNIAALARQMGDSLSPLSFGPYYEYTLIRTEITDTVRQPPLYAFSDRVYTFTCRYNGYDHHDWQFSVDDNGSVHYLGSYGDPLH